MALLNHWGAYEEDRVDDLRRGRVYRIDWTAGTQRAAGRRWHGRHEWHERHELTGGVIKKPPTGTEAANGVFHSSSANLVGASKGFLGGGPGPDFATFSGILSTGMHIDDTDPMPLAYPMPWQHIRELTLGDQAAVYTFLQAVQAAGTDERDVPSPRRSRVHGEHGLPGVPDVRPHTRVTR